MRSLEPGRRDARSWPGGGEGRGAAAEAALQVGRASGHVERITNALCKVGQIALLRGDPGAAATNFLESLALVESAEYHLGLADVLVGCAGVAEQRHNVEGAARLLGAATAVRDALDWPVFVHDGMFRRVSATVEGRLDREAFDVLWRHGRAMTVAAAIAEARSAAGGPGRSGTPANSGASLSVREREVLQLLVDGATNAAIAEALFISPRTVAHHVARIREKFGVEARTAGATVAVRPRLI